VITAASGDTVTVGGYKPIGDPSLIWRVAGGTGRFAEASGSGSYSYSGDFQGDSFVVTIGLTGASSLH
jgi:hypothetical protein